ncbi:ABC transporter substrate-binding protein [Xanthobacter autotrophicus]|uniref:ABC transporter substrate-binding protein n=1 Tax=Xanthobacter autotrophicus TaxID=280 RepID=UPI0037288FF4
MSLVSRMLTAGLFGLVCLSQAQAAPLEKPKISIAVGGSISQMNKIAYFVALNKKYFEAEGLTVESTAFNSGTAALQAVVAGGADIGEGAFEHMLRLQAKGQDLTCITVFGRYPGNVLAVRATKAGSIKDVADLKGKKIGISAPGASTHNFVAQLLQRAGVNWKDASYISIGTGASAVAAIRTGTELDAIVNLDPAITSLTDGKEVVVLVDSRNAEGSKIAFGGPYLADCLYARTDFIKANPNTSQAVANALVRAMQWLKTASIDDIIASIPADYYKGDEALYRKSLAQNLSAFQWDGIVTPQAAENVLATITVMDPSLKSAGLDIPRTYDNGLVERALQKYGTAKKP